MVLQYYSFTIDKATTKKDTTKQELMDLTLSICQQHQLQHNKYYKVQAFELKKPTKKFPKGRLHYHALLHSTLYSFKKRLNYSDVKRKGYSIKINLLYKPQDVAEWCGYIQKHKLDLCDITLKTKSSFKKDHNNKKLICVPCILDYLNK